MGTTNLLISEVGNDRNNVLTLCFTIVKKVSSNLRPSIILLPRELRWFQEVKKRVPAPELRTMKNNKGQTPKDIFSADHEELLKEAKNEAAKGIAKPCMLVATLIAALVFPAALTLPGGDSTNKWYMPFVFANAVVLFTSSASVLILLTIYTSSWFTENESFISLRQRLTAGLVLLFFPVYVMICVLLLASYMIFHRHRWARVGVWAVCLPAFMALCYLLYAPYLYALKTLMGIVWEKEIQKR